MFWNFFFLRNATRFRLRWRLGANAQNITKLIGTAAVYGHSPNNTACFAHMANAQCPPFVGRSGILRECHGACVLQPVTFGVDNRNPILLQLDGGPGPVRRLLRTLFRAAACRAWYLGGMGYVAILGSSRICMCARVWRRTFKPNPELTKADAWPTAGGGGAFGLETDQRKCAAHTGYEGRPSNPNLKLTKGGTYPTSGVKGGLPARSRLTKSYGGTPECCQCICAKTRQRGARRLHWACAGLGCGVAPRRAC